MNYKMGRAELLELEAVVDMLQRLVQRGPLYGALFDSARILYALTMQYVNDSPAVAAFTRAAQAQLAAKVDPTLSEEQNAPALADEIAALQTQLERVAAAQVYEVPVGDDLVGKLNEQLDALSEQGESYAGPLRRQLGRVLGNPEQREAA